MGTCAKSQKKFGVVNATREIPNMAKEPSGAPRDGIKTRGPGSVGKDPKTKQGTVAETNIAR